MGVYVTLQAATENLRGYSGPRWESAIATEAEGEADATINEDFASYDRAGWDKATLIPTIIGRIARLRAEAGYIERSTLKGSPVGSFDGTPITSAVHLRNEADREVKRIHGQGYIPDQRIPGGRLLPLYSNPSREGSMQFEVLF